MYLGYLRLMSVGIVDSMPQALIQRTKTALLGPKITGKAKPDATMDIDT